ncbi:hypothetical protein G8770_19900 [Aestuariicella hydrocarbonica]|uniref:Uncharacterized protein n=1 Tax=Pseudomaricurvus hydrocarbonicus TaxID=1470433 RepID=A0A9E5T1T5_9GAMM|nr:hypothetical protein [Aestuariicella hydrocarbonica]NHO67815.1 hypothetical protein [Aestuariicella hydrocarbonica]
MNTKNLLIGVLLLLSLGVGAVEAVLSCQGEWISESTHVLWALIFFLLTILWVVEDAKSTHFEKPFDFDFLMYVFWPIAFPYYLLSTRGIKGLRLLVGFLLILVLPWLAGLIAHVLICTA